MKNKMFILYDGRAFDGDPDDAAVLDTATSERECKSVTKEGLHGLGNVWYEYELIGDELRNGKMRPDL